MVFVTWKVILAVYYDLFQDVVISLGKRRRIQKAETAATDRRS